MRYYLKKDANGKTIRQEDSVTPVAYWLVRIEEMIRGKEKTKQKKWTNPNGLKGDKLVEARVKVAEKLEQELRKQKDKVKLKKFNEISAEYLIALSGSSNGYRCGRKRIVEELNKEFGDKYFDEITRTELEQYVIKQNEKTYGNHLAKAKDKFAMEKIHKAELECGVKKLNIEKNISLRVVENARKGKNISFTNAERLSHALGLKFDEVFEDSTEENYYSEETLNDVVETIFCIFERARIDEQILANPIPDYGLFGKVDGEPSIKRDIMSGFEHDQFLKKLNERHIMTAIPFELMTHTGIRPCEIGGLSWKDIDFENSLVNINFNRTCKNKEKRKRGMKSRTKTEKAVRIIPMNSRLKRKLLEWRKLWEELREDNEMFSISNAVYCDLNGNPRNIRWLNTEFERILYDAGITPETNNKKLTCYCLRHYWITDLINSGMIPADVQDLAGHDDIKTTMKYYYHKRSDEERTKSFLKVHKKYA